MRHRNFRELTAKMDPARAARAKARADAMIQDSLLRELRRAAGMTQIELAKALGVRQPNIAKLEAAEDMQISTLRRLINALGGELEITARLPQGSFSLSQFKLVASR